jgi:polysaccharide export outer membrane protein
MAAHKIMLGDSLRIEVEESPEYARDYAVAGDGTVSLPLLGRVQLVDATCQEAALRIKAALERDYFKVATVKVDVTQFVEGAIQIQGAVKMPGSVEVSGDRLVTLVEVLGRCGGMLENAAGDKVKIYRWKIGAGFERETIIVNVRDMLTTGDLRGDMYLLPRDMVFVPSIGVGAGGGEFLALGEVATPGFHAATEKLDVIRAVTAVGGVSRDARMESARLLRPEKNGNYKVIPLDLQRLFGVADMSVNVSVLPGDILFVPSAAQASGGQVVFLGELARTGSVPLPLDQQATLARTILSLGGFTKFANESKVKVLRTAPDGSKQTLIVDAGEILKTGAFERDVPLRNDDVIIVPERSIL